jgi:hypothetical protein
VSAHAKQHGDAGTPRPLFRLRTPSTYPPKETTPVRLGRRLARHARDSAENATLIVASELIFSLAHSWRAPAWLRGKAGVDKSPRLRLDAATDAAHVLPQMRHPVV